MKFAIVPFEGEEGEPSFLFVKELCKVVSDHADATYTVKMDEQKTAFEAEKEAIAKNIFEWVNKHLQEIIDGFPRYL